MLREEGAEGVEGGGAAEGDDVAEVVEVVGEDVGDGRGDEDVGGVEGQAVGGDAGFE